MRSGNSALNLCELVAKLADLDRPLDHPRVERGIVVDQGLKGARGADAPLDPREQHVEMERLYDHVVGAGLIGADHAFWVGPAGDEHDRHVAPLRLAADRPRQLGATDARHVQLRKHEIDRSAVQLGKRACAAVAGGHAVAGLGQPAREHA